MGYGSLILVMKEVPWPNFLMVAIIPHLMSMAFQLSLRVIYFTWISCDSFFGSTSTRARDVVAVNRPELSQYWVQRCMNIGGGICFLLLSSLAEVPVVLVLGSRDSEITSWPQVIPLCLYTGSSVVALAMGIELIARGLSARPDLDDLRIYRWIRTRAQRSAQIVPSEVVSENPGQNTETET